VARAVGTLLALVAAVIALLGVVCARWVVDSLVPGSSADTIELTTSLVRILFPGTALLVLSAWCLGVLNSHRRFFLPYVAPTLWSAAIIATAIVAGRRFAGHDDEIAIWLAWGTVIGSAAQLLVQLPTVIALLRGLKPSLAIGDPGVKQSVRLFVPTLLGRGSMQISAYIDQILASYLGKGIIAAMANVQTLYTLPVSLFGMAVSAAELPEMSSALGDRDARAAQLLERLAPALRRIVFLVVPSAVAFVAIGGSIVALLFQTGRFGARDTEIVWIILAGSALGLSAGTQSRLLASAFYALHEARPPLYASLVRLSITAVGGYLFALPIREALGYSDTWGAFALTASAGIAAWIEFILLDRWLARRIGKLPIPGRLGFGALGAAILAGGSGYGAGWVAAHIGAPVWLSALVAIGVYGAVYLGLMTIAGVPEARGLVRRVIRR
jgi:putative peptidoglycan lipid II flippase